MPRKMHFAITPNEQCAVVRVRELDISIYL